MSSNTQNTLNDLANEVQAVFAAETGRKLGFSKAKELAAKLSGLRSSNVKSKAMTTQGFERFIILPSSDGPDYDKHFAVPADMPEEQVDAAVAKLRAFYSLFWAGEDDSVLGISERIEEFMQGEIDTSEFLTKHAQTVFGLRYVNPTEYFAWDNINQLVKVTKENLEDLFFQLEGDRKTQAESSVTPIEFSYFIRDINGKMAGYSLNGGVEKQEWATEGFGDAPTELVQFTIPGYSIYSITGELWRTFEEYSDGLQYFFDAALVKGKIDLLWEVLSKQDVDSKVQVKVAKELLGL